MVPSIRRWTAVGAVVLVAVGCTRGSDSNSDETTPPTPAETVPVDTSDGRLTVGVLLPETGDGASLGKPIRDAIEAQVQVINDDGGVLGRPMTVLFADEASPQDLGALLGRQNLPVDAIIGPASSNTALRSLGEIVRSTNPVPVCSPSATALSLDEYPDGNWFFRTAPSDSLLMDAMAKRSQTTGEQGVAVVYLDDPYGRGLSSAFVDAVEARGKLEVISSVGVDRELTGINRTLRTVLADEPGIVVILGDEAVGGGLLAALDEVIDTDSVPQVLVNDSVRTARPAIEGLSSSLRERVIAVAPVATFGEDDELTDPFAVQALDCLNLIALAAELAESDRPADIRSNIQAASVGGVPCRAFIACGDYIANGRTIDYTSQAGTVDLGATGDLLSGRFEWVVFDSDGVEDSRRVFDVP